MHKAATTLDTLQALLALYPNHESKMAAINERNAEQNNLLYYAADTPATLRFLLALYPDNNARVKAIETNSRSLLFVAKTTLESLQIILALYPDDEAKITAIIQAEYGCLLLNESRQSPLFLRGFVDTLSTDEAKLKIINRCNKEGWNILHELACMNQTESLLSLLASLSNNKNKVIAYPVTIAG